MNFSFYINQSNPNPIRLVDTQKNDSIHSEDTKEISPLNKSLDCAFPPVTRKLLYNKIANDMLAMPYEKLSIFGSVLIRHDVKY